MYGEDLAYIHDAGFGDLAREAAPWVLRALEEGERPASFVVELGCGSGILLRELTAAGLGACGIDTSEALLERAQRAAPGALLRRDSLWTAEIPSCDAVIAMGEGLNYLPPGNGDAVDLAAVLGRIFRALEPAGILLFDLLLESQETETAYRTWASGPDWAVLAEVAPGPRAQVLDRRITTFRQVGEHYRRESEVHRLRLWSQREVSEALEQTGFSFRIHGGYGGRKVGPGRRVFEARRT